MTATSGEQRQAPQPAATQAESRPALGTPESPQAAAASPILAPEAQTTIVNAATAGIDGDQRRALILIRDMVGSRVAERSGKRPTQGLEQQLKVLKESKNPQDQALALDFEIAQKQYELAEIDRAITLYQNEIAKPDLPAGEKQKYGGAIEQLQAERDGVKDGTTGVVKQKGVAQTIQDLSSERQKIPGSLANSFQELATMFGASDQEAGSNPLQSIMTALGSVKADKKAEAALLKQLGEKGVPKDEQHVISDTLRLMRGEKTTLRKTGEFVGKASLYAAAFGLLMAWIGSRKREGQAMG
ncbi:hypothetical protein HY612_04740 [Candidatus Roizmanbacteria bacterium]|nr:hypothetical protein [Candidatus Roizmanbacteria bacterium]